MDPYRNLCIVFTNLCYIPCALPFLDPYNLDTDLMYYSLNSLKGASVGDSRAGRLQGLLKETLAV